MTGNPLPDFSDDPVVNFCVHEVIATEGADAKKRAHEAQQKQAKIDEWKSKGGSELPG